MIRLGVLDRIKKSIIPKQQASEKKDDKRFIAVIAVFAAVIALTVIRALFDETVAAQIRTLKFSAADGIVFTAALVGYLFIKKRGRK